MKRLVPYIISYIGTFVLGGGIFGIVGVFVGYELAQSGKPALLLRNLTDAEITQVVVRPHGAEPRSLGRLSPRAFRRVQLSGRDESVRISATTAAGRTLESDYVYVTAETLVFGVICADAITLEPAL